jgi:hypothetical protein
MDFDFGGADTDPQGRRNFDIRHVVMGTHQHGRPIRFRQRLQVREHHIQFRPGLCHGVMPGARVHGIVLDWGAPAITGDTLQVQVAVMVNRYPTTVVRSTRSRAVQRRTNVSDVRSSATVRLPDNDSANRKTAGAYRR